MKTKLVFNNGDSRPSAETYNEQIQGNHRIFVLANQAGQMQVVVKIIKGEIVNG